LERLDNFLKTKGFFESREKAQKAIKDGVILVNGNVVKKASFLCNPADQITIQGEVTKYVSRGAYKLEKALDFFGVDVEGKNAVDIGSSTGGFSDVLLQRNVGKIVCIDVGKDQLHKKIKENKKVALYEQTDFRNIAPQIIEDAQIIVIDVSFISTKLLMEKLKQTYQNKNVQIISLVKPQFECGAIIAKKFKGIINNKKVHYDVLYEVIKKWNEHNFYVNNLTHSPIVGGDGNVEYLLLLSCENTNFKPDLQNVIEQAFKQLK
jgi:23S rRNA (cytidine1920-2'-O)/16S rRNA (cytidine1409-2'-O)-methyltransferase